MPDLGPYAFYVLSSYGAALAIIAWLIVTSMRANSRARAELEALEARRHMRRKAAE